MAMAVSLSSLSLFPAAASNKSNSVQTASCSANSSRVPSSIFLKEGSSADASKIFFDPLNSGCKVDRRLLLTGAGAVALSILSLPTSSVFAEEEMPGSYSAFVDKKDGYSYYYPSDWREFDFRAHDSAFKDRYLQLQNVRVCFLPTEKNDLHDLGPMQQVVLDLVNNLYAAPNQIATVYDMQERSVDGKNYYTFEYKLLSPNFARTAFATIAIANGRYYQLVVGANDRRWRRVRNRLKVVADSFKVLDI